MLWKKLIGWGLFAFGWWMIIAWLFGYELGILGVILFAVLIWLSWKVIRLKA